MLFRSLELGREQFSYNTVTKQLARRSLMQDGSLLTEIGMADEKSKLFGEKNFFQKGASAVVTRTQTIMSPEGKKAVRTVIASGIVNENGIIDLINGPVSAGIERTDYGKGNTVRAR